MELEHKHKLINTAEWADEVALIDYYWWKCECGHHEKIDDNGYNLAGDKVDE